MFDRQNYIKDDSPIKKILLKLFEKTDKLILFDVGACEGEESIRYSKIFPFSSIYIFEPLPKNQIHIIENISKYNFENLNLIPFAVSDEDGEAEFYVSSGHPENLSTDLDWDFGNKSSSLLSPEKSNNPSWLSFEEKIQVETIKLASFSKKNEISEVDFMHMDVQGAELKVLKGANEFIKNIKAIWLEVSDIELYKNQPLRIDIEEFMISNGFDLIKSELEGKVGDQFYLNKNYFKTISFFKRRFQFHIKKQNIKQ